ncbi:SAM-dependent methyltransferase [Flexithrix dorotheae]|uniref:SAM-dependent methyltransferase n=1 Tax=Flexithrix dorotheae TaxID=70993 RepID=UPI00037B01E5|nr:class I SAM-dependent methyltransferase [Flexithrix dorotheae]
MKRLSQLYDQLFEFEAVKQTKYYPIHKKLKFPGKNNGYDLVDWLMEKLEFRKGEFVLDAGCGTGNTLFRLAKEKCVKGKGISISKKEIEFANSWRAKENLKGEVEFRETSFDAPLKTKFNKIIAIESLKHSEQIKHTMENLADAISQNGKFIIIDDFLEIPSPIATKQKQLWNANGFVSLKEMIALLEENKAFEVVTYDLTSQVIQRPFSKLIFMLFWVRNIRFFAFGKFRLNLDIYLGGLLLELLYHKQQASYIAIIATKKFDNHD